MKRLFLVVCVLCMQHQCLLSQAQMPVPTQIQCTCGTSSLSSTMATLSEAKIQMRRGVPAFIVLRGQRFGGKFGDAVGGENIDIPFFPNQFGAQQFGGGISRRTAQEYGAILGPFKAGVPTVATIIADIVDVFGDLVTTATSTHASLVVGNIIPEWRRQWLSTESSVVSTSSNGRFEWRDVQIEGLAGTTLTLQVRHASLTQCGCPVQVSLQGGFPFFATFATQGLNIDLGWEPPFDNTRIFPNASGPFAAPGVVGTGRFKGSSPYITVGQTLTFPSFGDVSGLSYNSIAVIITDRFGNYSSFATEATLSLFGGNSPVNQVTTPLVGNVANSVIAWGLGQFGREVRGVPSSAMPGIARTIADLNQTALGTNIPRTSPPYSNGDPARNNASEVSPAIGTSGVGYPPINNPHVFTSVAQFPNFQVWGATSSNVQLQVTIRRWLGGLSHETVMTTFATVDILPGRAIGIAPVLIPDPYDSNRLKRMPSRFVIGRSNADDPRSWFYVQAIDEFGNRVDRGPNAYNGGTANITFYTPQQGLPRAAGAVANAGFPPNGFQFSRANDPNVKANNQVYSASGTSAVAVMGLYTFNNFTPLGPSSLDALGNDVVLTFEDVNLLGNRPWHSTGTVRPIFQRIPPVTTATTTFLAPTSVRLSGQVIEHEGRLHISPNPIEASNSEARVQFVLQEASDVRLEVFSLHGTRLTSIHAGFMPSGEQHISLPIGELSSGVYAVRVLAGTTVQIAMMTVVR